MRIVLRVINFPILTPATRNTKKYLATFPPASLAPLLASPNASLLAASVRPNGVPILHLSTGAAFSYDPGLATFTRLADRWFAKGSDVWPVRTRNSSANQLGPVAAVESQLNSLDDAASSIGEDDLVPKPKWWGAALTLGHLEGRLAAARALESGAEYKQTMLVYAKRIADEGFRAKAEEVIRELFGPVYWCVVRPYVQNGI